MGAGAGTLTVSAGGNNTDSGTIITGTGISNTAGNITLDENNDFNGTVSSDSVGSITLLMLMI